LVCQIDLLSSIAKLVGSDVRIADSEEMLNDLMGVSHHGREELIIEATTRTAMRKGDWIMIPPYKGPAINESVNIELGNSKDYQLYNLKDDLSQQNNLAKSQPEKLKELINIFEEKRGKDYDKIDGLNIK
jgi:arylsulfatase A-like enzyme